MPFESPDDFTLAIASGKPPQLVFPGLMAFPPNRDTLGGTAYVVETTAGNLLVDSPPWTETTQAHLKACGVRWFFLTQRNAMAQVKAIQQALDCEVVVQEQEAYLLPQVTVTTFGSGISLSDDLEGIWTSGYSPGAACLYWRSPAGGVLLSGRHLLPTAQGDIGPLRTAKTFHWPRQLRAVGALRDRFAPETLRWVCPGASIGFLRGQYAVDHAYEKLLALDLEALKGQEPGV